MKKIALSIALLCAVYISNAQVKLPAPSPAQTVKQEFGLSNIELSYSRPAMKGRKIFGDLVPFDKVWRTGANGATTLTFGDEVIIGDKKIPAGKYGLLSIPGADSWTLIITKQTDVTSPAAYKPEEDVVRVNVKPMELPFNLENFSISFENITAETCELTIIWDNTLVSLPIKTDIDAKVMASIEASMKSDKPAYFQAASYYLESGKDLNKAVEWFAKAAEAQPDAFWIKYQQARALAKAGKKSEAKQAALQSKELASTAKNQDYVTLNDKLIKSLN
ncbi:DUF2911 domain-containing protein [Niabella ginsengisoli]|uniref:DUF2911 domain-containing protein n=1 Tax=Niabella ginsengisoli TaxID=522298 RepID=A0ABS9SM49_9BACT|nr:DUF2911 domain-containing protein [Niabella ginsengisoli]MCH5599366.1 DUF2911 domain-containing protein [Niabella ginsengisoli]